MVAFVGLDGEAVCPGDKPGHEKEHNETSRRHKTNRARGERPDPCDRRTD